MKKIIATGMATCLLVSAVSCTKTNDDQASKLKLLKDENTITVLFSDAQGFNDSAMVTWLEKCQNSWDNTKVTIEICPRKEVEWVFASTAMEMMKSETVTPDIVLLSARNFSSGIIGDAFTPGGLSGGVNGLCS